MVVTVVGWVAIIGWVTIVFPNRSMVGSSQFQDMDVRKVQVFIVNVTHNLGKGGDWVWHPHMVVAIVIVRFGKVQV